MRIRRFATAAVCLVLASGVAACGGGSADGDGDGEEQGPIRIGYSIYLSGAFAAAGEPLKNAAEAWTKMTNENGGILGRDVEVLVKDDAGEQTKAIQNLRTFASEGIRFFVPNGTSSICTALAPVAQQLDSIIVGACADPSLLPPDGPESYYMADLSMDGYAKAAGALAKDKFPEITTWDIYTMDYLTGHTVSGKVKDQIEAQNPNAKVASQVYTPLGASDQRAYINSLNSQAEKGDRGLYIYTIGSLGPNFMKQASPIGLFDKYDVVVYHGINDQILDTVGADLPEMWGISDHIPMAYEDVEAFGEFRSIYEEMFPNEPFPWPFFAVTNPLDGIKAAIEEAGTADVADVRKALDEGFSYEGLKGEVTVKDHYFVTTMPLIRCVGDSAAENGWTCDQAEVLPVEAVTPEQFMP